MLKAKMLAYMFMLVRVATQFFFFFFFYVTGNTSSGWMLIESCGRLMGYLWLSLFFFFFFF